MCVLRQKWKVCETRVENTHTHTHTCVLYCSAGGSDGDAETHRGFNLTTFTASSAPPSGCDGDGSQLLALRRRPPVNISDVSINNGP